MPTQALMKHQTIKTTCDMQHILPKFHQQGRMSPRRRCKIRPRDLGSRARIEECRDLVKTVTSHDRKVGELLRVFRRNGNRVTSPDAGKHLRQFLVENVAPDVLCKVSFCSKEHIDTSPPMRPL